MREACSINDVQVSSDAGAIPAVSATGNGQLTVAGGNWAFRVWSTLGTRIYAYNTGSGARFTPLN